VLSLLLVSSKKACVPLGINHHHSSISVGEDEKRKNNAQIHKQPAPE